MLPESSFGRWLKQQRSALDLTQEALAERVGCAPITIRMIEAGKRRPSQQLAVLLADELALSPDDKREFVHRARQDGGGEAAPTTDLPASPPPDLSYSGLLAPTTSFIGRERDLAAAGALLRGPLRLLTLTGPPGIGKTRLALGLAGAVRDHFPDGVHLVALAAISDPLLVPQAIMGGLQLRATPGQTPLASLATALRDKQVLLLLDNLEQVLAAAPFLADLLAHTPGLKLLVTSRTRLRLSGEQEYPVSPLALPAAQHLMPPGDLAQYAAVDLFIQRAGAANPQFALTPENAPAVAEICLRLDGLPLALELAAARSKLFTPHAMLARLHNRLGLLTGGARDLPARQQTLHNAISWSYDLLSAAEQQLFANVALFVGGFSAEAAEAVAGVEEAGGGPRLDVFEGLAGLLDQSLLLCADDAAGEPRFQMLETLREYGLACLAASGAGAATAGRHAAYYLELAEQAEGELTGAEQAAWLARLEREHDNLRAALRWMLDNAEVVLAARLVGTLWRFWWTRGHGSEGQQWAELVVARLDEAAPPAHVPPVVRAKALHGAGVLARDQGNYGRAEELLLASLAVRRALDDRQAMADTLNSLGLLAGHQAQYAAAETYFAEGLALFRALGSASGMAKVLGNSAELLREQGEYARATTLSTESLALQRSLGNRRGTADALNSLGLLAHYMNDDLAAQGHWDEALALYREAGVTKGEANVLANMGELAMMRGEYDAAATAYAQSLAMHRESGDNRYMSLVQHNLALVLMHQGHFQAAHPLLVDSLQICAQLGNLLGVAQCLAALAAVALAKAGDEAVTNAVWLGGAASALLQSSGAHFEPTIQAAYTITLHTAQGRLPPAAYAAAWQEGEAATLDDAVARGRAQARPA